MKPDEAWKNLQQYLDAAKKRQVSDLSSDAIVDFGPLSFLRNEDSSQDAGTETDKESVIRRVLALGDESTLWGSSLSFCVTSGPCITHISSPVSRARIHRSMTSSGYFVVTPRYIGFWSKTFAHSSIRYRLPMSTVKEVNPVHFKVLCHNRLSLSLEGQNDLLFDFKTAELRDRAVEIINAALETQRSRAFRGLSLSDTSTSSTLMESALSSGSTLSGSSTPTSTSNDSASYEPHTPVRSATSIFSPLSRTMATVLTEHLPVNLRSMLPKAINIPHNVLFTERVMHFVCLTIGSRGDVQPYIALGLGLKQQGHRVTIVTHEEYKEWVVGFGIEHRTAGGDPGALMKLSVENKVAHLLPP